MTEKRTEAKTKTNMTKYKTIEEANKAAQLAADLVGITFHVYQTASFQFGVSSKREDFMLTGTFKPAVSFAKVVRQAQDDRDSKAFYRSMVADDERERGMGFPGFTPSMEVARKVMRRDFNESDCGGVFDGNQVVSDADPGL